MTNDAELRRQALEMAIRCDPAGAVERAEKFLTFLRGESTAASAKAVAAEQRWPKMGDTVIYCGAGFSPSPAIVTHAYSNTDKAGNRLISLYVLGTGGAFPKPNVPRGDWRFMAE